MYLLLFIIIILLFLILKENKEYFTIGGYNRCGILTEKWQSDDSMFAQEPSSISSDTYSIAGATSCNGRFDNRDSREAIDSTRTPPITTSNDCENFYYINEKGQNIQCVEDQERKDNSESYYNLYENKFNYCKDGEIIDTEDKRFCNNSDGYPSICSYFPYYTYYTGIKKTLQSDETYLTPYNNESSGCDSKTLDNYDDCPYYYEYNETMKDFYKCKSNSANTKCVTDFDVKCKDQFLHELQTSYTQSINPPTNMYYIDKFINFCASSLKSLSETSTFLTASYVINNIDQLKLARQLYIDGPVNTESSDIHRINNIVLVEEYEDLIEEKLQAEADDGQDYRYEEGRYAPSIDSQESIELYVPEVRRGSDDLGSLWNDELTSTATIDAPDNNYNDYIEEMQEKFYDSNSLYARYLHNIDSILMSEDTNIEYIQDLYDYFKMTGGIPIRPPRDPSFDYTGDDAEFVRRQNDPNYDGG